MATFAHFLLTVFNVRLKHGGAAVPDDAWLQHRFRLFEDFCYPSVRAQTIEDFTWLVLFDAATPAPYKERIRQFATWKPFVPCFVDEVMTVDSFASMKERLICTRLMGSTTHLITTNLDNDDGIHARFMEDIQHEFSGQDFEFLNFAEGFQFDAHRETLYVRRHLSNPFVSLVEKLKDARTVWCAPHPELSQIGPMRQIGAGPMWLQVIHGRNVSNTIADARRVPLTSLDAGFEAVRAVPRRPESGLSITLTNLSIGIRSVIAHVARR